MCFRFLQKPFLLRGNRRNSKVFCIENGREEINVSSTGTGEFLLFFLIEREPIPILLAFDDNAVFRGSINRFEVFCHRLVIVGEERFIPIDFVEGPWNHANRVAPNGRCIFPSEDVRDDLGNFPGFGLVEAKVPQPFAEEGSHVKLERGGFQKDVRITRPSHPFVALGAIAWDVQGIVFLGPEDIVDELLEFWMRGRYLARAIEVRVPNNRVDVFSG